MSIVSAQIEVLKCDECGRVAAPMYGSGDRIPHNLKATRIRESRLAGWGPIRVDGNKYGDACPACIAKLRERNHGEGKAEPGDTCGTCKWWTENKSEGAGYCGCREQRLQITTADVSACEHYGEKTCATCEHWATERLIGWAVCMSGRPTSTSSTYSCPEYKRREKSPEPVIPTLHLTLKDIPEDARVVGIESRRIPGGMSFSGGQIAGGKLLLGVSVDLPIPLNVRVEFSNGGSFTFPIKGTE